MFGKDNKVFVLSLIASSFALVTTLKAQNYSYETSYKPYTKKGLDVSSKVEVMPLPMSSAPKDLIDLSSIYANGVSVAYTNDRYPINEISSKRKVMRMASVSNYFRGDSSEDWTVRIGEEEVLPLGYISEKDKKPNASLNQSRRTQYGDLRMDEISVSEENPTGDVMITKDNYTYPEYSVVDENEVFPNSNNEEEVKQLSERIKKQKSYPWVDTKVSQVMNDKNNSVPVNPWGKNKQLDDVENKKQIINRELYSVKQSDENVQNIKIERKNMLHKNQQARFIPEISSSRQDNLYYANAGTYAPESFQEVSAFESYADGTSSERFENNSEQKTVYVRSVNAQDVRPLLVPIENEEMVVQSNGNEKTIAYQSQEIINPVKVQNTVQEGNNISLTELKINFKPFKSDLSVKTVKWLKEFSQKAAVDFDNLIEISISPNMPYLQNERLLMLKGVLNSNGVYDQQIRVRANRRNADSVVIKLILSDEVDDGIAEYVDTQDLSGAYYYYY